MRFRSAATVLGLVLAVAVLAGGPHVLEAKGSQGWMRYWGDGTVHLSGRGTLTVKNASNVQVTMDGKYGEVQNIADGAVYTHFEGSLTSIGMGGRFELRGWDLAMHCKGKGHAWFQGMGATSVDGGADQPWPSDQLHNKWLKVGFDD